LQRKSCQLIKRWEDKKKQKKKKKKQKKKKKKKKNGMGVKDA
jgi:hypothetical protein